MFRLLEKYRNSPAHKYINSSQLEEDSMEAAKSMTNKEAKSKFLLEYCPELCNDYKGEGSCDNCEINVAIKALEKQIPKKPILKKQMGLFNIYLFHCPVCDDELISKWNKNIANPYCHHCGQRLRWMEDEDEI